MSVLGSFLLAVMGMVFLWFGLFLFRRSLWPEIENLRRLSRDRRNASRGFAVIGLEGQDWSDPVKVLRLKQLGNQMSGISLRCSKSGWLPGTEYIIPELRRRAIATGQAQPWGDDELTLPEAQDLARKRQEAGAWANLDLDSDEYVPFDPTPIPQKYLDEME